MREGLVVFADFTHQDVKNEHEQTQESVSLIPFNPDRFPSRFNSGFSSRLLWKSAITRQRELLPAGDEDQTRLLSTGLAIRWR